MDIGGARGYHDAPQMKVFHCDHCGQLLFFENVACMSCGRTVAFVPELSTIASLDLVPASTTEAPGARRWRSPLSRGELRMCSNYALHDVCNWAFAADGAEELCRACRLTQTIPNLSRPGNARLWYKLEVAKRRLVYTLDQLGLPLKSRTEDPVSGIAFEFLEDPDPASGAPPVMTGHNEGTITVNVAEADDAERVRRRVALNEPYRTLLGHFRHESGHYFWDRLVQDSDRLEPFRALFGDEREDYDAALRRHYDSGPGAWQDRYISAYATMHPWEDWAETFAHYLHIVDVVDTADSHGFPAGDAGAVTPIDIVDLDFHEILARWRPINSAIDDIAASLGASPLYPFEPAGAVIDKLAFVHARVAANSERDRFYATN